MTAAPVRLSSRSRRRLFSRRGLPLAAGLAAALAPAAAAAQVNIEPLRSRLDLDGRGLVTVIEAALDGRTGNTEGIQVAGAGGLAAVAGPHLAFFYLSGEYARFNGTTSVQKSFGHVRYNYAFRRWVAGEVFAQAQTDALQRLSLRRLVGLGPRFALHRGAQVDVFYGAALMHEVDTIASAPATTDAGLRVADRWSNYVVLSYAPDRRTSFVSTLYVQPALDDFSNYRLLFEAAFELAIDKTFSAKLLGSVHYDSVPPQAVRSTDTEIKPAITATF